MLYYHACFNVWHAIDPLCFILDFKRFSSPTVDTIRNMRPPGDELSIKLYWFERKHFNRTVFYYDYFRWFSTNVISIFTPTSELP